jgi:putative heme-binding domain-containing protein
MPHNVVILPADKVESFGEQSMVLASNPRAIATHYVPNDPAEICFSPILNPGDQYTVYFEAPQQTGRYRFLCTYPGHWKVMQGSLFVLPDDQPLPPPAADEIGRRFVKRWQPSDFTSELVASTDASQRNGKVVFQQAGCIKCHRIGQDGSQLGPDLTEVTKRHTGPKLLQQILSPSSEIHPKYQTWIVVTDEGKVHAGLLLQQNESEVTLLPNPLRPDETVQIQRANIEEMEASKQSTMPDGLLMTFTRQEILDLLAYLQQESPVSSDP